jgi:uncharacterized protein YbjT (DUF2867 family)
MAKVIVFGGNGFVGSNVLKELFARSVSAVSVSRSGIKPNHFKSEAWAQSVEWHQGDAMNSSTYESLLQNAKAVVISVGSPPVPFVDESYQIMMNGGKSLAESYH